MPDQYAVPEPDASALTVDDVKRDALLAIGALMVLRKQLDAPVRYPREPGRMVLRDELRRIQTTLVTTVKFLERGT